MKYELEKLLLRHVSYSIIDSANRLVSGRLVALFSEKLTCRGNILVQFLTRPAENTAHDSLRLL